jgi:hypothetical protein
VAFAAVADRTGALFLMAAEAELVRFLLVNATWEWPRRPFMTLGAGVHPHMLGVVEVHIPVVGLEDLGFGKCGYEECEKQSIYESFHNSNSVGSYQQDEFLYDSRWKISRKNRESIISTYIPSSRLDSFRKEKISSVPSS